MSYKPIGKSMKHLKGGTGFRPPYMRSGDQSKTRKVNPDMEGVKTSRVNRGRVGLTRRGK